MSSSHSQEEVGIIVGEASPNEFLFVTSVEKAPPKWEYLVVYSAEEVNGNLKDVPVIAQVQSLYTESRALPRSLEYETAKKIEEAGIAEKRVWGRARVLGYISSDETVRLPRRAVVPGKPVFRAPADLLEKFYSFPKEEAIHVGSLITRSDVPVSISIKGFRRHLAIIGQTGSGKSYLAGVIAEELLRKGATVIILDPHADYVFLSRKRDGGKHELSDRVVVFRNPASTGRYSRAEIDKVEDFEIGFPDLSVDEISEVARVPEKAIRIRDSIEKAINNLRSKNHQYTPEELLKELERLEKDRDNKDLKEGARAAQRYIKRIVRMRVFTTASTPIEKLLKPMQLSVVDLSGLEDRVADYIVYRILSEVFEKKYINTFEYPVYLILEEAHRFIPAERDTYSSEIIRKIAAEGRKFGIFLILMTQRPSKIHPDALSQCNSQIILRLTNPKDQEAISASSERMSQDLLSDLPGLNKGEAVIVGEMVKAPVMIRIRERRTKEGGADIDVLLLLEKARKEAMRSREEDIRELREELKTLVESWKQSG